MKELTPYKNIIIALFKSGILSTLKKFADMCFVGKITIELNFNSGGIGDAFYEVRERIKKQE
jgi:transcription elongation factor GreA-like protein